MVCTKPNLQQEYDRHIWPFPAYDCCPTRLLLLFHQQNNNVLQVPTPHSWVLSLTIKCGCSSRFTTHSAMSISYICILFSLVEAHLWLFGEQHLCFSPETKNGSQDPLPWSPIFLLLHGHDLPKVIHREVILQVQYLCSWQQFFTTPLLYCCDRQESSGMCVAAVLHLHMQEVYA